MKGARVIHYILSKQTCRLKFKGSLIRSESSRKVSRSGNWVWKVETSQKCVQLIVMESDKVSNS